MSADTLIYGVRGPDPRNTVVPFPSREEAEDALLPGEVVVTSRDGGGTWQADDEMRPDMKALLDSANNNPWG